MIITRKKALELLSDIATDKDERTTERLKAIEMLAKFGDLSGMDNKTVVFVDDVSQALES